MEEVKQNGDIKAKYTWTTDGIKRGVRSISNNKGFEYLGSLVYVWNNGSLKLEGASFSEGRIVTSAFGRFNVIQNVTDHLGSVRVMRDVYGSEIARYDYTPFGERRTGLPN